MTNKEIITSFFSNEGISWKSSKQNKSLKCFYYNGCRILMNDYKNPVAVITPNSNVVIHCLALDRLLDTYKLRKVMEEHGYTLGGILATPKEMEEIIFNQ